MILDSANQVSSKQNKETAPISKVNSAGIKRKRDNMGYCG